jgi:hypothetical protein
VFNHLLLAHFNDISKTAQFGETVFMTLLQKRLNYPEFDLHYLCTKKGWLTSADSAYRELGWKVKTDAGLYVFSKREESNA